MNSCAPAQLHTSLLVLLPVVLLQCHREAMIVYEVGFGNSFLQRFDAHQRIFCGGSGQHISDLVCHCPPWCGHGYMMEHPSLALVHNLFFGPPMRHLCRNGFICLIHVLDWCRNVFLPLFWPHNLRPNLLAKSQRLGIVSKVTGRGDGMGMNVADRVPHPDSVHNQIITGESKINSTFLTVLKQYSASLPTPWLAAVLQLPRKTSRGVKVCIFMQHPTLPIWKLHVHAYDA